MDVNNKKVRSISQGETKPAKELSKVDADCATGETAQ
jgi:hypothetical protein